LLDFHKMSSTLQTQLDDGARNFEPVVKNTFLHFNFAPRKLRRSNTAPEVVMRLTDDPVESSDGETASCTDSSQPCFSACDADSGTSTPECFSPREWQKFEALPIPKHTQMPIVSPGTDENPHSQDLLTLKLLRADGVSLGLDFLDQGKGLRVVAVRPDGAVEAWNRQCQTSQRHPILPGDDILAVNSAVDPESMRREAHQTRFLKLSVRMGPAHFEELYPWVPQMIPVLVLTPGYIPAQQFARNEPVPEENFVSFQQIQFLTEEDREACHHVWRPDPKKFSGKHTKVTKTETLALGEFAFMIHAQGVSHMRGGSSFQASDGKGTIDVKCNSENVGLRTVRVTVGDESYSSEQNFSADSICKIPKVFDFRGESDKKGEITIAIDFL